ncbi:MAG: hypothetical protein K940chlam5_01098 [Candidatus Anoxychlamydiales bacterium]|nr:hypothetical protein [Candidatus Anoxychlamydiales bacterium]
MSFPATMPLAATSLSPTSTEAAKKEEKKSESSAFTVIESVIRTNAKNVLKVIEQSLQWISHVFANLKDNIGIINTINFTKFGQDTFAFGDFGSSIMKMGHSFTLLIQKGYKNSIRSLAENALELTWSVFKIFKALKNTVFPIYSLASKFFIPLKIAGGGCFALSSANRIYKNTKKGDELLNEMNANPAKDLETQEKNEATILARVFLTTKNICTFIIGFMLAIGFAAPGLVYLTLGSTILITDIVISALTAAFGLKL